MQEEEFCLEGLKKTQEEQDPVFKSAILSGFQIAAHSGGSARSSAGSMRKE